MESLPPWLPTIDKAAGPLYLAIADAIAEDLAAGRLAPGRRLPAQRQLADQLKVDFTTVTRGYSEARRRGLVEARVGQGTFVAAPLMPVDAPPAPSRRRAADLSMNLPPLFDDGALTERMWAGVAGVRDGGGISLLLDYQPPAGALADRAAGAVWLHPRLPELEADRVLIAAGAQSALAAILPLLAGQGDLVYAEALTFPGFRALARQLGVKLVGIEMDGEGLSPEALDAACRTQTPKAIYCTPTLHNPTTATMSAQRREAIAGIARRYGVPIIEDDAYAALPSVPVAPLAAFAPELTWYVGGVAKALSPALRIAYVAAPDGRQAARLATALRATIGMASPLNAAIVTRWIQDGVAADVCTAIRQETAARYGIARGLLAEGVLKGRPDAFHMWLNLPPGWTRGGFLARLGPVGAGVVASDAFSLASAPPEAVRIGLGAAPSRDDAAHALTRIRDLLGEDPVLSIV